MKRRRLLALSGTLIGSLLAGCLGGGDSSGSNTGTRTETTTTTSTATSASTSTSTQRPTTEPSPSPATDSPVSTRSTTADQPTTRPATRSPTGTDGPTTTDRSALRTHQLTVTDRACGNPTDEGAIGFENGRVTLTGTITGSDGCATATLEDVTYDRAADRLRVVVATETESGGGAICTQCLTEIDYEASVALENGTPGTVVLIHRTRTGETRVATASS